MFKKFPKDSKYTKIALYTFITIGALMILWRLIISSENLWTSFKDIFAFLWGSVATIAAGLILGYILSPGVSFIEKLLNKFFDKKQKPKRTKKLRLISIALVYIILLLTIAAGELFIKEEG